MIYCTVECMYVLQINIKSRTRLNENTRLNESTSTGTRKKPLNTSQTKITIYIITVGINNLIVLPLLLPCLEVAVSRDQSDLKFEYFREKFVCSKSILQPVNQGPRWVLFNKITNAKKSCDTATLSYVSNIYLLCQQSRRVAKRHLPKNCFKK